MKTVLIGLVGFLSLTGCYDTFTKDELDNLKGEAVIIRTTDGLHYHLKKWAIDEHGDVIGDGLRCSSPLTTFGHPLESSTDFSGTIRRSSIVTVKTSSAHASSGPVLFLVIAGVAVGIGLLIALAPRGL